MQEDPPEDMGAALMQQALDFWINPEIERRQAEGALPKPIELVAAQIVFRSHGLIEIRLNNEVRAEAQMILNRSIEKGEGIRIGDITEIRSVELLEEDLDSAHITLIRTGPETWTVSFNAQYNRQKARVLVSAAEQYLQMAQLALKSGFDRVFVDNLHSAAELAAKAQLILNPNPQMLTSKRHEYVVTHFNIFGGKLRNAPESHVKLLNRLNAMRGPAKYSFEPFALERNSAENMLRECQEMVAEATRRLQ